MRQQAEYIKLMAIDRGTVEPLWIRKDTIVAFQQVAVKHLEKLKEQGIDNASKYSLVVCEYPLASTGQSVFIVQNTIEDLIEKLVVEKRVTR